MTRLQGRFDCATHSPAKIKPPDTCHRRVKLNPVKG